ncbi:DUF1640 domain-containing protein (plasmid) [Borrelia coriaceae]|uniref:BDR-repeat family protein n=1 Tax=Borrelia coriaceae ATCC 43381 TaxID=1408429 RepID=W5SXQ2_9SPIR|nr:Bdr family repetitive protein [Borrelia coriaceae]AHH11468.1 BDR-repeat family protein [Borrelia coriaceae ATCC 43381]UPA17296.1 DUF1640 domain-containing protein [Borrelia coriaceae]
MGIPQPVITQQMVLNELMKAGINRDIADDLAYRYYRNELTFKDIEFLKENFDIKLEKVEASLQSEIKAIKTDLDNKIDNKFNELDKKIDTIENNLNVKIDTKFNELDKKIDIVENNLNVKIDNIKNDLKSDITFVINEVSLIRKDIEINKIEIDNNLNKALSEFKSTSKIHHWMFGTIITIFIGILLTLIFK